MKIKKLLIIGIIMILILLVGVFIVKFYAKLSYSWEDDGIILMKNKETGEYACFGCGERMCIDPALVMEFVNETSSKYCYKNFKVVSK